MKRTRKQNRPDTFWCPTRSQFNRFSETLDQLPARFTLEDVKRKGWPGWSLSYIYAMLGYCVRVGRIERAGPSDYRRMANGEA